MIELIDSLISYIEYTMPYSPIAIFIVSGLLITPFATRIYTQRGRIWTDIIWLMSGSSAILLIGIGIQYDTTILKTKNLYQRAFEFRQRIGHEASYINERWCRHLQDSPEFKGDENQLKSICESSANLRDSSIQIGLQFRNGFAWENFPKYQTSPVMSIRAASSYDDVQIISEFGRILTYYVSQYNFMANSLQTMATEIRIAIFIKLARLIFLHIAAAAAALRLGRAIFELRQTQTPMQNKT